MNPYKASLTQQAEALVYDLRQQINPQYADQRGTESYERKECADMIDALLKQLAEANDLAAGRLEIMQSDRKQALVWRDRLAALEQQKPIGYVFNDAARDFSGSVIRKLERFDYIPVFLAAGAKPEATADVEGYPI